MIKHLPGKELISFSGVCTMFKDLTNENQRQTEKIAFKVFQPSYIEGTEILMKSTRYYECLVIDNILVDERNVSTVLMGRRDWKHLKMSGSCFETASIMVQFLSSLAESLEIIDFNRVTIRHMPIDEPRQTIVLPKLQKIASQCFHVNFQCTTLKELELRESFLDQATSLLTTNRIEIFTLSYMDISLNFTRSFREQEPLVSIKKIVIKDSGRLAVIGVYAAATFQRFLKMQTSIEEVHIDTVGKPKQLTSVERLYESKNGDFYRRRQDQRRDELSLIFTIFLSTILIEMKSLKKLSLGESRPMIYPFFPRFPKNQTITELNIEMLITNSTQRLVKEVIQACPNVRKLSVIEFGQLILEDCFVHMKNLEVIEANVVRLELVPSKVKLVSLKQVKFNKLLVRDKGDLSKCKLIDKHNAILKCLRGPLNYAE